MLPSIRLTFAVSASASDTRPASRVTGARGASGGGGEGIANSRGARRAGRTVTGSSGAAPGLRRSARKRATGRNRISWSRPTTRAFAAPWSPSATAAANAARASRRRRRSLARSTFRSSSSGSGGNSAIQTRSASRRARSASVRSWLASIAAARCARPWALTSPSARATRIPKASSRIAPEYARLGVSVRGVSFGSWNRTSGVSGGSLPNRKRGSGAMPRPSPPSISARSRRSLFAIWSGGVAPRRRMTSPGPTRRPDTVCFLAQARNSSLSGQGNCGQRNSGRRRRAAMAPRSSGCSARLRLNRSSSSATEPAIPAAIRTGAEKPETSPAPPRCSVRSTEKFPEAARYPNLRRRFGTRTVNPSGYCSVKK